MPLTLLEHSLAKHILTRLRCKDTEPGEFRSLARGISSLLIAEATKQLPIQECDVTTPLETMQGYRLDCDIVAVPILRAGLAMLDVLLELIPNAKVGYVGLERDENTALARTYYRKLPNMKDATALLLDPMLATGGSAVHAASALYSSGAKNVTLISVVAAPEGVERLTREFPDIKIVTASVDRELNAMSYILPGLGDFGDRLFGT